MYNLRTSILALFLCGCSDLSDGKYYSLDCVGEGASFSADFSLKFRESEIEGDLKLKKMDNFYLDDVVGEAALPAGDYTAQLNWSKDYLGVRLAIPADVELKPDVYPAESLFNALRFRVDRVTLDLMAFDHVAGKCSLDELNRKF